MKFLYRAEIIDYDFFDNPSDNLVLFLHGWGGNKYSFSSTINLLKPNYKILTVTLPTIQPTTLSHTLLDYTTLIQNILSLYDYKKLYIICHSFGFRIVSMLNALNIKIDKLVITAGAGIKFKHKLFSKTNFQNTIILLKNVKYDYLYEKIASPDYKILTNTNKKTFKNIVNLNTRNFSKFKIKILLFWGEKDNSTKLKILKWLSKNNNTTKYIIKNGDHFAYLKHNQLFNNVVKNYLEYDN